MAGPVYLADTSAYVAQARDSDARARFAGLLTEGRLAVCQMTALEYFNNAPDPKAYEVLWTALHGQRRMDVTATAMNRAMQVHRMLAERSQHRNFRLPDLIIAATAEQHGATVLHYDADYDRIAAVTGQPVEWVTARGSL
ncbi:MAG: PIN domain nuclease [Streptosporangiaceae bacterium]|jgi:predicted nucleic acid-binding protein